MYIPRLYRLCILCICVIVIIVVIIYVFRKLTPYNQLSIISYLINRKDFITELEHNKSKLLNESFETVDTNTKTTPKIIWQTYHDKKKIPPDVYENIKKYAPEYEHIIIDDREGIVLLNRYFNSNVVQTFNTITCGAHKADFLRYAVLYLYGGIYLDIKTVLIENIDDTFPNKKCVYTLYTTHTDLVYQGIIVSPPRNPLFLSLMNFIVNYKTLGKVFYLIYCYDFLQTIKKDFVNQKVQLGLNKGKYIDYYLYQEKLFDSSECKDGLDRYGFCSWGVDPTGRKVIKIRRKDYPFK